MPPEACETSGGGSTGGRPARGHETAKVLRVLSQAPGFIRKATSRPTLEPGVGANVNVPTTQRRLGGRFDECSDPPSVYKPSARVFANQPLHRRSRAGWTGMERTPAAWARRSPRGYPSPRAPSPSILRGTDRSYASSRAAGAERKRVDLGAALQTRKEVREYDPRGSYPSPTRHAAARASAQETREWKQHIAQTGRPFERSLRRADNSDRVSPTRRRRSTSPYARSTSVSPGVATSPR